MDNSAKKLNKEQKEAVDHIEGPLLIIAGAGTGKTAVLTEKIAHLIENNGVKPESILALAFNEKAAAEMTERVESRLEIGYIDMNIYTFHGFCQMILEQYALELGIPNRFRLLTQTDAWILVKENLYDFPLKYFRPLGNPSRYIHDFLSHVSACKDELVTPEKYASYADSLPEITEEEKIEKEKANELAAGYKYYQELLHKNEALDFGDLIYQTVRLLQKRPNVAKLLSEKYKYILVDEFQDVNWAQYQLVRLLSPEGNITAVGDDDQSIYAFRGASVSNILRFSDDYPDAKKVVLTKNYRSTQQILDFSYAVVQNNNPDRLESKLGICKSLKSQADSKNESVIKVHSENIFDEVDFVIDEIKKLMDKDDSLTYDDFAVLVRANNHAEPFLHAFEKAGLPYEFLASSGLFRQPVVEEALNFFRVLVNVYDSMAFYSILRIPPFDFSVHDIQLVLNHTKRKAKSLYGALCSAENLGLSSEGIKNSTKIIEVLHESLKRSKTEKPSAILTYFFTESGYFQVLTDRSDEGGREAIRQVLYLKQFFELLSAFEVANTNCTIKHFMDHYENLEESGDQGAIYQPYETENSVDVMTVHKSKGLEYKYVFVANLVEQRFPSRRNPKSIPLPEALVNESLPEGDSHYQEERRLFYVAATRAKFGLYLLSSDYYMLNAVRKNKPSRFLQEADFGQLIQKQKDEADTELGKQALDSLMSFSNPNVATESEEKAAFPIPKKFSYSQIQLYEKCPYQYKLGYLMKIPKKGNAALSFGSTIHNTLQEFYERIRTVSCPQQESIFDSETKKQRFPDKRDLLDIYKDKWIDDWYEDDKQKKLRKQEGIELLENFYKENDGNWTVPAFIESGFNLRIGEYTIHGRIDRIDQKEDGTLEIIDYKTGNSKENVSGGDKDQLTLYQLAASSLPDYYNVGEVSNLRYYYLLDGKSAEFLATEKHLDRFKEKLISTLNQISSGDFKAKPDKRVCGYCDYRHICKYRV